MNKPIVLIIDNDKKSRENIKLSLEKEFIFLEAENDLEGLARIEKGEPDLVLLDMKMAGIDGIETLYKIKNIEENLPVIMLASYDAVGTAVKATQLGADDFIQKPLDPEELKVILGKALEHRNLKRRYNFLEKDITRPHFNQLIGKSNKMRKIYQIIEKVASTRTRVLIRGESGTGKELVAQIIHEYSPRKDKPFVPVNIGAHPESLIESELFGHEKGAYTGAVKRRRGLFEEANGGTLFLDEIGDMTFAMQVKLLRVIEEGTLRRVGGTKTIPVDIRLITATHQNLEEAVEKGSFREDLFYRLNVTPIFLPPLRERKEDIPLLVHHFLQKYSSEVNKRIEDISPEALEILLDYDWPGNVRELENIMERVVILSSREVIEPKDLNPLLSLSFNPTLSYKRAKEGTMANFKRNFIDRVLKTAQGNITKAARLAQMPRQSLQEMMRELKIDPEQYRS